MMKRILQLSLIVVIIAASAFVTNKYFISSADDERFVLLDAPEGIEVREKPEKGEKEGIDYWIQFSEMARANQVTGDINPKDVAAAKKAHAQLRNRVQSRRASNLNINFEFMGPSNKGGRTRDILFDMNNPNRVYTGGVSGGLYISNNGGGLWEPYVKSDTLAGVGVVSLAQAANGDIYVGTGEYIRSGNASGIGRARSFIGEGIWKSTDGGNTFNQVPSTAPDPDNSNQAVFAFVSELVTHPTDPNTIAAGTASGLRISRDGGATWEIPGDITSPTQMRNGDIQDLAIASDGTLHIAASGQYVRGSISPGSAFESVAFGPSFADLKLALAPSDENYIYGIGCNGIGETTGVFRSTDGGSTWRNIGPNSLPSESFNPTGTQGTYDMEIAVHPLNKDLAFTAGQLAMYEYNYTQENGQDKDFWWPISNWWSGSPAFDQHYVHADHHRMVFHPENPNVMYVATDGGIYKTQNASSKYPNPPVFQQLNKGYGVAQFNNISTNLEGQVIGGTQDNGVIILDFEQNEAQHGFRVGGFGDGGYCEASKLNNDAFFASSYYGILGRSANGGDGFSGFYDSNIDGIINSTGDPGSDGLPDASAPFVPVSHLHEYVDSTMVPDTTTPDPNDSTLWPKFNTGLFAWGPYDGVWVAYNALDFGKIPTWFHISSTSTGLHSNQVTISAMNISADGNHLFFGTGDGYVYRVSGLRDVEWVYDDNGSPQNPADDFFDPIANGITTTRIFREAGRYVTDIAVDKNNPEHVVFAMGNYGNNNYVYRSTNAVSTTNDQSFSTIQNNLPKMPVYSILIDYYDNKNIIAGTELGVYSSNLNGSNWSPEFDGLPTTPVLTLNQEVVNDLYGECYILYAGTYGKSIYASSTLSPSGCGIPRGEFTVGVEETPNVANSELKVYPNPTSDFVNLSFGLDRPGEAMAMIYNMNGQVVLQSNLGDLPAGKHTKRMNINGLNRGNYLVVVRSGNNQAVEKISVVR